jgi:quaternary ammonium compound-resistance protein SugE
MPWILLTIAGLLEIGWVASMNRSEGFSKPVPAVITIVLMLASFSLLSFAMKTLPMGVSYSVWVGIGAVGSCIVGVVWMDEKLSLGQVLCLVAIAGGIVGLKLLTPASPAAPTPS